LTAAVDRQEGEAQLGLAGARETHARKKIGDAGEIWGKRK